MDLHVQFMVYGSIIMITIIGRLHGKIIELFLVSVVLLTFWEYIVGVLLEKVFKTKYWDYSDHKINFQGRICLTNSIAWGFLGVGFINYINPFVWSIISKVPANIFNSIIYGATAVLIVDTIISIIKINTIRDKLKKIQELNDEIKEKIKEIRETNKNKQSDKNKVTEGIHETLNELKIKRNRMARKLYRYAFRIKRAFPTINKKEITLILNKKFSLKRNITKEKRRK